MGRTLFTAEDEVFCSTLRDYLQRKVVSAYPKWLAAQSLPREFFTEIAQLGVQGIASIPNTVVPGCATTV